jgi:uncharacterized membrane protein YphA (DoxX/SURF4 family)
MMFLDIVIVLLALSFLFYGIACLRTEQMVDEFKRYGLPQFRELVGALEVAGGIGLVVGYFIPVIQILAAGGIALLMLMGCIVRIRTKDSFIQILPAFTFLILSVFVLLNLIS